MNEIIEIVTKGKSKDLEPVDDQIAFRAKINELEALIDKEITEMSRGIPDVKPLHRED